MNHADVERHLADYLEGDLPLGKRALVDAHLDECEMCSAELAELQDTISLLRSLPDPEVPANFTANVMRRIRTGDSRPTLLDHVQAALSAIFAPRILYPVSMAMVVAGVLISTGQLRVGWPFQREVLVPTQVLVNLQPREAAPTPAPRQLARNDGGGAALVGARSADGYIDADAAFQTPPVPYRYQDRGTSTPGDSQRAARLRPAVPLVVERYLAASPSPVPARRYDPGAALPASSYSGSPERDLRGSYGGGTVVSSEASAPSATSSGVADAAPPTPAEWLETVASDPDLFAAHLDRLSLAEYELWVGSLTRHAIEQGRLEEVVAALRSGRSRSARLLADEFAAAAQKRGAGDGLGSSRPE